MKFKQLLILGALLITGSVAKAIDANVWQKPTIAAPEVTSFTTYEVGKTIYLYNVASHLFYTNGNNWGTRASLIFATGGNGNGATAGEAIRGIKVEFTQTDAAKEKGDDVVELKSDVKGAGTMLSAFADGATSVWTDNNSNACRFWKVTAKDNYYLISNVTTEPDKFLGWEGDFTDTRLNLIDEAAGTQWKMVEEAAYNDWLAAVEANGVSIDAFKTAVAIYNAAMRLKEVLVEAEAIGAEVTAELAVYNNTNSTLDELNAAITSAEEAVERRKQEQAQGNYENATVANPVEVTSLFVKNPSYENNKNDDWEGSTPGFQSYTNAEFFEKVFDTHQSMTGLREGVYMLALQAFYRPGYGDGSGYTAYVNKDAQIYDVKMYANSGSNQFTKPIVTAYEGAGEKVGQGSEMAVQTADGTTIYIPNDMNSAAGYFADGRYYNSTLFEANADSIITIGLKNSKSVGGNWVIYDNWQLIYLGAGEDAYVELAKSIAAALPDYSNLAENVVYTPSVMDAYLAAKAALATTTGKDAIKAAIAAAKEAAAAIELNISLWQKYQDLCTEAKSVAANEDYNIIYREELGDYEMDLDDNLGARSLTNDELQALCDQIEAAIDKAIHAPLAGADMTNLLKNPGFDEGGQNNFPGWNATWKNPGAARVVASCAEFWNTESFDMYQELTELPKGVYEISVQGFYRYLRGNNAWSAYLNKDPNTLAENIPTYIYMNDNQTPFTNVFGDPRREELQLSPDGTTAPAIYTGTDYVSLTDDITGNTYFFPDNMQSSADCFGQGMYTQKAYGLVAQDGDKLRLGVIGSSNQGGDSWVIFDNFRLTYKGMDAEIIKPVLETNIAKAEASLEGYMGKSVRAALSAAVEEAKAALDKDGQTMFNALSTLFANTRAVNESKAKFNELVAANESLAQATTQALECSIETLQQARMLNITISENLEAGVYEDEDVDGLLEQIANMIKELAKPEGFSDATDENPKDANWCIVNPKYADNNNEGWTSTKNPGISYNICEVYDSNFNYYQDIELTAGTYELTAPGFYRFGSAADDYAAYQQDPTQNNNLVMYVTVGTDSMAVAMPRLASAAEEYTADATEAADGRTLFDAKAGYAWVADPVANADNTQATGYIVANNMEQAANKFAAGLYAGTTITFKVPEDMKVRIGMSKTVQQSKNWCIWGGWQLTYYGKNSAKEVTPTGITAAQSNGQVVRTEFFNLNGARINAPRSGVMIIKQTMADGTVKVRKAVVK